MLGSMKRANIFAMCLFLCLSPLLAEEPPIDFGSMEGSNFVHRYFGFQISIPDQWQVQDTEARKDLQKMGKEIISGDDRNMKAILDASELNTLNLLTVFRYPRGTAVDFNPSFACVAEKVSHLPGIKKGSDYLFHTRNLIEQGKLAYKFSPETGSEKLGGETFDFMDSELDLKRVIVKQRFYATIRKGYALCLVISYQSEEMKQKLDEILKTVQFENQ